MGPVQNCDVQPTGRADPLSSLFIFLDPLFPTQFLTGPHASM